MLHLREERMSDFSLLALVADGAARKWGGMTRRERFAAKCVTLSSGCIQHSGAPDKDGYPMVTMKWQGKHYGRRASHVALALAGIEVPAVQQVNHHCDNRLCVNPDHLFLGTQSANVHDMMAKDRHAQGERHTISLLTENAVRDIRANCRGRGQPKLFAAKYDVSISTVLAARNRQNWKHVA